jgi:hypothetical protein
MRWWSLLVVSLAACASATPPGAGNVDASEQQVDASVTIDAAPGTVDAAPIDGSIDPPMDITLSQTTNATIASNNTLVCGNFFGETLTNSFYRVFPLADYGITGPFHVKSVQFAVQTAESWDGTSQSVTINVGTYTGTITPTTSALQGGQWFPTASAAVNVPDGGNMMLTALVDVVIPAGSKMMVELRSAYDGNRFFPGSNRSGETYPTFWGSQCEGGIKSYTSLGDDVDLVMTVTGTK